MIKKKKKKKRKEIVFFKFVSYIQMADVSSLQYTSKRILIQCETTIWVVWKLSLLVFLKKNFAKNIYSMWNNNLRVWKLSSFFSIFIFISWKMFLHSLLLKSDDPLTDQDWIISGPPMWTYFYKSSKWLNIFYQYDGNCVLKNHLIFVAL